MHVCMSANEIIKKVGKDIKILNVSEIVNVSACVRTKRFEPVLSMLMLLLIKMNIF